MKKTHKILIALAVIAAAIGFSTLKNNQVSSHSEGPAHEEPAQTEQTASEELVFKAPKGSSLSLLVRRSLQIIDKEDDSFSLSKAQIIYAETNIVKQLGERKLEIGEEVKIERKVLKDFAAKSQSLSEAKIKAWEKYAKRARFNLDGYIEPASQEQAAPGQKTEEDNEQIKKEAQKLKEQLEKANGTDKNEDVGRIWLIGLSVLVIVYYLTSHLFARNKSATPFDTTKTTRKKR